jgi:hypothetical protein
MSGRNKASGSGLSIIKMAVKKVEKHDLGIKTSTVPKSTREAAHEGNRGN